MGVGIAQAQVHSDREGAGVVGDSVQVNGVAVTDANLNNTTPVAVAGRANVEFQRSGSGPDSVSAQTPAAVPVVLDRKVTDLDVVNTVTETAIFTFSVPANAMGTNRMLRLNILLDYLNNVATTNVLTFRIKFGGTTIYQGTYQIGLAASTRRPLFILFWLVNQAATNDQIGGAFTSESDIGAPTTGLGRIFGGSAGASDGRSSAIQTIDAAIDTTAAQTFEITVQWDAANVNLSCRRRLAILELV